MTWSKKGQVNAVTFTNICSPNGDIVWFSKGSASISPSHGDLGSNSVTFRFDRNFIVFLTFVVITGTHIYEDDENIEQDIDCDNGIVNLCVGSDKYFPVICGDRG